MTTEEKLELAIGALADIAFSADMTIEIAKRKAERIYNSLREAELQAETADNDSAGGS